MAINRHMMNDSAQSSPILSYIGSPPHHYILYIVCWFRGVTKLWRVCLRHCFTVLVPDAMMAYLTTACWFRAFRLDRQSSTASGKRPVTTSDVNCLDSGVPQRSPEKSWMFKPASMAAKVGLKLSDFQFRQHLLHHFLVFQTKFKQRNSVRNTDMKTMMNNRYWSTLESTLLLLLE